MVRILKDIAPNEIVLVDLGLTQGLQEDAIYIAHNFYKISKVLS